MTPSERAENFVEAVLAAEFADVARDAAAKERREIVDLIKGFAPMNALETFTRLIAAIEARGQQ